MNEKKPTHFIPHDFCLCMLQFKFSNSYTLSYIRFTFDYLWTHFTTTALYDKMFFLRKSRDLAEKIIFFKFLLACCGGSLSDLWLCWICWFWRYCSFYARWIWYKCSNLCVCSSWKIHGTQYNTEFCQSTISNYFRQNLLYCAVFHLSSKRYV